MRHAGFYLYLFYSVDKRHIFCKIKPNLIRIAHEAQRIGLVLLLDENNLKTAAAKGVLKKKQPKESGAPIAYKVYPIHIPDDSPMTKFRPFESIFSKFDAKKKNWHLFAKDKKLSHPFSSMHRIKLIETILEGILIPLIHIHYVSKLNWFNFLC